ncbi:hypothetical protein QTP86_029513, partial [Hemibagrus guttatus]
ALTALKFLAKATVSGSAEVGCVYQCLQTFGVNASLDTQASTFCTEKKGPCSSQLCRNRGKCEERGEKYICMCPEGFTGSNCEVMLEHNCKKLGCQREQAYGTAKHVRFYFFLLSILFWGSMEGLYQYKGCLIYPNQCLNGATCISMSQPTAPPFYRCTCSTGCHCEAEMSVNPGPASLVEHAVTLLGTTNVPAPQVCSNGGWCFINSTGNYSCICAPGWTGPKCSVNINDCTQHWCQNGATCVDGVAGYSCQYEHGCTGVYCELDTDYCIRHQCSEDGICVDQQHNYTYQCQPGCTGVLCEIKTDECKSSPCANGATCMDIVASYWCLCAAGFKGELYR